MRQMPKIREFGTESEYAEIISNLIQQLLSGFGCVQYITYEYWDLQIFLNFA